MRWALFLLPWLTALRELQGPVQEEKIRLSKVSSVSWGKGAESQEDQRLKFVDTAWEKKEYRKKNSILPLNLKGFPWLLSFVLISACVWKNYPKPRKEPSERLKRKCVELTQGSESCIFLLTRLENAMIPVALARVSRRM